MNKVIIIGNLTKDPITRVTQTGKKVVSFSLAVSDGKDQAGNPVTQYFNFTAWDKKAELVEMYVKKGHKLGVTGKLQNRSWDKPDGSKAYATDILVLELELLTSRAEAERINSTSSDNNSSSHNGQNKSSADSGSNTPEAIPEIKIDDIELDMPF